MTATADMILERRRLRRRLSLWRILAIIAIVAAVIATLPTLGMGPAGEHIARITIDGTIVDDHARDETIRALADNPAAQALIVRVNSPGGTVVASENIYKALRQVAAKKPVIAVMDEVAASGGYIAALGADRIIASGNTMTASIGVVMAAPNINGLMDKLGVDVLRIKSGELKAEPALTSEPTPEVVAAQEALIADTFAWFRDLVVERRALDGPAIEQVSDGRVLTGRQALSVGLVDSLGDEQDALAWLAEAHDIGPDLRVVDHELHEDDLLWPLAFLGFHSSAADRIEKLLAGGTRLYALPQ
ncbi:MAG TPA: signal peptide peptidase SppA [Paracoccaceae bacterium]|nr:signal peptide peptidase SppA [Paracoccaceae bacterium]